MTNLRLLILLAFTALCACAATGSQADSVTITGADDRHTVRLARGGILTIKLDVQFGTGFIWRVEHNDAHLLVPLGQPETERRGEGKPGTVEVQVFRFRAEAAGKTTLALAYAHPWEKDVKPAKTFGIMVEIH